MDTIIFSISGFDITLFQVFLCLLVIVISFFLYFRFQAYKFFDSSDEQLKRFNLNGLKPRLAASLFFLASLIISRIINYDIILFGYNDLEITFSQTLEILTLFSVGVLFDWIISHVVIRNRFRKREVPVRTSFRDEKTNESKATNLVRYIVYLYVGQILLKRINLDAILMQRTIKGELFTIQISDIIVAIMIIFVAKVIIWFVTQISLYRMYKNNETDEGIQFAINQLVSYVIYVVAIIFALDRIVSDMSIIYGGAAALLVGVGLGLQQTFNDFFSGLVLLFERSVMIGDILEIDGQVGRVIKIGLRASRVETRNSVSMLIPNSKLVNQSVVNWTHSGNVVRFEVSMIVPYGSDTSLIKELLLKSLQNNNEILSKPVPFVRLNDFGDNGLYFSLYFFSTQVMWAEDVRSHVRFEIDRIFRENNIIIPYPQREIRVIQAKATE
ncbi:MAG: mechanosensitive ion channel domain-containing protein [Saprospiraceae bacterium]|jgi:small-conductance mechanosensitive channel|nr:mechanosensitive ion channel [Saprospiraceae bacterium]